MNISAEQILTAANIVVLVLVALLNFFQAGIARKLNHELKRRDTELDQSLLLLYRARDAAIRINETEVFLSELFGEETSESFFQKHIDLYSTKRAEWSAASAELRGLAFALDDSELLNLVNHRTRPEKTFERIRDSSGTRIMNVMEGNSRIHTQKIHTRIAELTKQAIAKK